MGSPELEATFDTIVEAFLFLDKNGDGKLNKEEMVMALNEASPWEKSPGRISRTRFSMCYSLYIIHSSATQLIPLKTKFVQSLWGPHRNDPREFR